MEYYTVPRDPSSIMSSPSRPRSLAFTRPIAGASQLGVGHTGASDKNVRAPKTSGASVPGVPPGRTASESKGERVDQEGHLITLYRDGLSLAMPHGVPRPRNEGVRPAGEEEGGRVVVQCLVMMTIIPRSRTDARCWLYAGARLSCTLPCWRHENL